MRCHRSRACSDPIPLIDRTPINPLDPIAQQAAGARAKVKGGSQFSWGKACRPTMVVRKTSAAGAALSLTEASTMAGS